MGDPSLSREGPLLISMETYSTCDFQGCGSRLSVPFFGSFHEHNALWVDGETTNLVDLGQLGMSERCI